ncbi:hypothetical protein [Desulfonatronum sp. SC1]|uniref:hypothetical protein n=1 Tax=Desulfonatronum sp. SC1 TaxID=2109626 RepID=UPI000D323D5F|nr:hypothetical protein [Desulfonatronum sp. SC1]PTN37525.1 hypothetical protein C6366_06080 [Desulfonatronum sp. SC1]
MANREKIMVLAMILAVVYGAYTLLAPAGILDTDVEELDRAAITEQIDATTTVARTGRLTSGQETVIQTALRPWIKNPFFRPPPVSAKDKAAMVGVPDPLPEFVYQGYLETDTHRLAMINGRTYTVGERMREQGFEVLEIYPKTVVIAFRLPSGEVNWRQAYPLEDGFL